MSEPTRTSNNDSLISMSEPTRRSSSVLPRKWRKRVTRFKLHVFRKRLGPQVQSKKVSFDIIPDVPDEKALVGPWRWKKYTNMMIQQKKKYCYVIKEKERKKKQQYYVELIQGIDCYGSDEEYKYF